MKKSEARQVRVSAFPTLLFFSCGLRLLRHLQLHSRKKTEETGHCLHVPAQDFPLQLIGQNGVT
jgi:hypothetical protein